MVRRKSMLEFDGLLGFGARANGDISSQNRSFSKRNEPAILSNRWLELMPISELRSGQPGPARVNSIERFPQHVGGVFGRIQSGASGLGFGSDSFSKLVAPHARMVDIGRGMQREVATG